MRLCTLTWKGVSRNSWSTFSASLSAFILLRCSSAVSCVRWLCFLSRTLPCVMTGRVYLILYHLCFSLKHLAHFAHSHKVVSVYVNNACVASSWSLSDSSSSMVSVVICPIGNWLAMPIEALSMYPCGFRDMFVASMRSFNSDTGIFPVHNLSSGFFGNGAFMVAFPMFFPELRYHVFLNRVFLRLSCLCSLVALA